MNLPKQVAPVNRQATKASRNSKGIAPSGECGCFWKCLGVCVGGTCHGVCI